jgi:hypothetical protein
MAFAVCWRQFPKSTAAQSDRWHHCFHQTAHFEDMNHVVRFMRWRNNIVSVSDDSVARKNVTSEQDRREINHDGA